MAGMEGDDAGAALDHIVTQFNTYEDYLDSQITTQDLFYLEVRREVLPAFHCLGRRTEQRVPLSLSRVHFARAAGSNGSLRVRAWENARAAPHGCTVSFSLRCAPQVVSVHAQDPSPSFCPGSSSAELRLECKLSCSERVRGVQIVPLPPLKLTMTSAAPLCKSGLWKVALRCLVPALPASPFIGFPVPSALKSTLHNGRSLTCETLSRVLQTFSRAS